jgi:hypothetical protein
MEAPGIQFDLAVSRGLRERFDEGMRAYVDAAEASPRAMAAYELSLVAVATALNCESIPAEWPEYFDDHARRLAQDRGSVPVTADIVYGHIRHFETAVPTIALMRLGNVAARNETQLVQGVADGSIRVQPRSNRAAGLSAAA